MFAGFHSVLREEIEQENPKLGDLMAVVYMGARRSSRPVSSPASLVHIYRVVVQSASAGTSTDGYRHLRSGRDGRHPFLVVSLTPTP